MIVTFIAAVLGIFMTIYIGNIAYKKYKIILLQTSQHQQKIFRQDSISSSGTIKGIFTFQCV